MVISTRQPLSTGIRLALIGMALLMLQLNVPLPQPQSSLWIIADMPQTVQDEPVNLWLPVKNLMAMAKEKWSTTKAAFTPSPEFAARTFKIVKVDSKRIGADKAFPWPVKGSISSAFGMRRHPVTKKNSFHNGVDIKARQGTGIYCPTDGVVVSAGHAGLLGRLVKVKTNLGRILYFGHMHRIKCVKGQKVKRGSLIGTVGSSGRATGPHLHFSVVSGGKYLNPLKYLSAD